MSEILYLCVRKAKSLLARGRAWRYTRIAYLGALWNPAVRVRGGCRFGRSVRLLATDGGSILLESGVVLADRVEIVAHGGNITIGKDVFVGIGSIVVCRERITIASDSLIAEYVVIRDHDHNTRVRPVRTGGFVTAPVHIGRDVWIGSKATILRGTVIGDRCIVGAHALVKSHVDHDMLAMGIPARAIPQLQVAG
jgi:acetyltransferase-like isoleucine patch superfamily enzyme